LFPTGKLTNNKKHKATKAKIRVSIIVSEDILLLDTLKIEKRENKKID
jgi:hypothetical protein